jgi:hypothetical protein
MTKKSEMHVVNMQITQILMDFDQTKLAIGFYDIENLCLPF